MKIFPKLRQFFANDQHRSIALFGLALMGMMGLTILVVVIWIRPLFRAPLAPPLNLPLSTELSQQNAAGTAQLPTGSTDSNEQVSETSVPSADDEMVPSGEPLCGEQASLTFLLVGIDYRGGNYLYGLADVIRVVRVDYTEPRVNVVSLPRALLVDLDANYFSTEGPALLNQAYFFGTPGMDKFLGDGYGAGALAHTIQDNFGVTVDHYLVMNFDAFVRFIDALGGIGIDLPEDIKDTNDVIQFPAGIQWLDGEQVLQLARIRKKYSDLIRIDHQTLILQAIFRRMQDPTVLVHLGDVIDSMKDAVVTDISPEQISNAVCLLTKLTTDDLYFSAPPGETIRDGKEYIPSLKREMQIFTWDDAFTRWMQESLAEGLE